MQILEKRRGSYVSGHRTYGQLRRRTVYFLGGFFFVDIQVSGGDGAHESVVHVPPAVHQFHGGWRHIPEVLSEGHHGEAVIL